MELTERLYDLNRPIMKDELKQFEDQLTHLQGNILQGHGRGYSVCLFLRFKDGKQQAVKEWIRGFAPGITSAQRQFGEIAAHREHKKKGGMFRSFFLSAKGYDYLEIEPQGRVPFDSMKDNQERLSDPDMEGWYQTNVHAMVLLAYHEETILRDEKNALCAQLAEKTIIDSETVDGKEVPILFSETGRVKHEQRRVVEHFGYADGVSQPLFFDSDIERLGGTDKWHPGVGPSLVLVPDLHQESTMYSGSYLVFRKLEQNVFKFKEKTVKLAQDLGLTGGDVERAEALVVGRFKDGTPVIDYDNSKGLEAVPNNFNYDHDATGLKCPFHAHIRKVNPREHGSFTTPPLIVRRGITYDDREKQSKGGAHADGLPERDVGLLFMCYQRDIKENFEFLQMEWGNSPLRPKGPDGQIPGSDPIIGQGQKLGFQKWPREWGTSHNINDTFEFRDCVTCKGGEYFFAPSIHFLAHIS